MTDKPRERTYDRKTIAWLAAILALALGLRLLAAGGDFWLDEIWSWSSALKIASPLEAFTAIHDDNNHYLNTLWMHLLGNQTNWLIYRMFSIVAGVGAVALMAVIGFRRGRRQGLFAASMAAVCYMLVLYSSEARGFAPAIFFSLICLEALERYFERPRLFPNLVFCLSAAAGLLSQLTFIYVYVGLYLYSLLRAFELRRRMSDVFIHALRLHTTTWVVWCTLCAVDLQYLTVGGGPIITWPQALSAAVALTFGAPYLDRLLAPTLTVALLSVLVWYCVRLLRKGDSLWLLYAGVLFAGPTVCFLMSQPRAFYPRHFLVLVPLALLALADILATPRSKSGRALAIAFLVAFCGANFCRDLAFLKDGRGHYLEAVRLMAGNLLQPDGGRRVFVGGTQDFQTRLTLAYYNQFLPAERALVFVPKKSWTETPPDWIVVSIWHTRGADGKFMGDRGDFDPAEMLHLPCGTYRLTRQFLHSSDVSGNHWLLYRGGTAGNRLDLTGQPSGD